MAAQPVRPPPGFGDRSKVSRKYSLLTGMAYKAVSRCQKPGAGERLVSSGLKESHCEWSREDKGESVQHEPWRGRQAQTLQDIFGQANYCSTYPKSTGKSLDGSNLGRDWHALTCIFTCCRVEYNESGYWRPWRSPCKWWECSELGWSSSGGIRCISCHGQEGALIKDDSKLPGLYQACVLVPFTHVGSAERGWVWRKR